MKHTRQDLKIMQGWSLERKIRVAQTRIMEWYMRYDGQVFISFSGGKDSTVLLDLARRVYPDIPAVYVDTGLEYPELRDFVKTKDNVIWLRPRYPFTQILEKYGYPIISKEVSDVINGARKGQPYRLARLNGELLDKNGKKSIYNCENYKYLLDAPFKISARCCYHMKKAPLNKFEKGVPGGTRLRVSWPAKASCGSNPGSSLAATASSASGLSASPLRSGWKKIFCGI